MNFFFLGTTTLNYRINDLERGVEYEFRVAGQNLIGIGQEAIKYLNTPEGPPTGPPTNITHRFQTPDVVCLTWDPPTRENRNGQIIRYDVQFHKKIDHSNIIERNITQTKAVFTNLEENTEYVFHVRAYTNQGAGPFSDKITIETDRDIGRAPMSVKTVATSDSSVEVWWEHVPSRGRVIGKFFSLIFIWLRIILSPLLERTQINKFLAENSNFKRKIQIFYGKFNFLARNLVFWREIQLFGEKFSILAGNSNF